MGTTALLSLVGAFYVFAGVIALRAGLTARLLDQALAQISLKPVARVDILRTRWNLAISALTFLSGVMLLARLDLAPWAFIASALTQAAYLFHFAPRMLDPLDPPDPLGRRRSTNAFVIYVAATLLVGWLWATGQLIAVTEAELPVLALAGALPLAFAAYAVRAGIMGRRKG